MKGACSGWLVSGVKVVAFILLALGVHASFASELPVRDGDLIFQTSRSAQSTAVQKATRSPYSHMGIVFLRNGKPFVLEAIETVQYTPIEKWIARGVGGRFVVKRLKDAATHLNGDAVDKLREAARPFEGRAYDLTFEWSDDRIYCSELVWKIYQRGLGVQIGKLEEIKDFNLTDPVVREKMKERYGDKIPMNEPVISPVSMFNSSRLVTVAQK